MANATKKFLSGSTSGAPFQITATASPGTLIHTSTSTSTVGTSDEIWVWAYNNTASSQTLQLQWGNTTASGQIGYSLPASNNGPYLVVPGWVLNSGLTASAFTSSANGVVITGFVNTIVSP